MAKYVRSRAPLRLGLAGGGTDVSPYCDKFTGYVLNATIDRYAYCTIIETSDQMIELIAADQGHKITLPIDQFPLPLEGDLILHKATYNRIIRKYNNGKPASLRLTTHCDAPVGSGLGASSTVVVSIIKGFEEFFKIGLDDYSIANLAYEIERIDCGLKGGRQDHYSATFGGFNFMEFYDENKVLVNPLRIRNWIQCELEASILLYYTGRSRLSGSIIDEQSTNVTNEDNKSIEAMHELKKAALLMKQDLLKGDFVNFMANMNKSWENKKASAASITNPIIEEAMDIAINRGAIGGKVSGAGGGGFITFFVPSENRMNVANALKEQGGWISNCHFSSEGSQCWSIK